MNLMTSRLPFAKDLNVHENMGVRILKYRVLASSPPALYPTTLPGVILTYLDDLMAEQIHCQVEDSPEPHAHRPHMQQNSEEEGGKHKKVCVYKCREPSYPKMPMNKERDIQTVVNICVIFESNMLPPKNKINLRCIQKFHLQHQRLK